MDQIYQNAEEVLVWLGEEADQSGMAMTAIWWAAHQFLLTTMNDFPQRFTVENLKWARSYCEKALSGLTKFFERQYFVKEETIIAFGSLVKDLENTPKISREQFQLLLNQGHLEALFAKEHLFWEASLKLLSRP